MIPRGVAVLTTFSADLGDYERLQPSRVLHLRGGVL